VTTALADLDAADAVARLRRGELTAEALVRACLDRIAAEDGRIGAFEHLDPEVALEAARRIDGLRTKPLLAGLPVGVKDIFDTFDHPTERGTEVFRGRRPESDAAAVGRLRAAGAVILGKTVTTEMAYFRPGKTRNPHDLRRTPGGSSSGSAAAVASRLVPAAIGTQTAGSVIRPASFCGVVGFKPTYGLVPMEGATPQAPSLDTFGVFVRDVEAVPLLLAAAAGSAMEVPPPAGPPRLGLCRTPAWPSAELSTRALVEDVARALSRAGAQVEEVELPAELDGLADAQRELHALEAARSFRALREEHGGRLSRVLLDLLDAGERVTVEREAEIRALADRGRAALPAIFARVDALLTPAAPGEAPATLETTGDPAFNRVWTMLGTPAATLPLGKGPAGLPVGIQVVGAPGRDGALAATCAWIVGARR
jgi:amidase